MRLILPKLSPKLHPYIKIAALVLIPVVICACSRGENLATAASTAVSLPAVTAAKESTEISQLNKSPVAPTRNPPTPSQTSITTPTEAQPTAEKTPSPNFIGENYQVEVRNNVTVNVDSQTGDIVEFIDNETGEWTSAYLEYSSKYPPGGFEKSYTADIEGGLEIPIELGLQNGVTRRLDEPISEIHLAQDIAKYYGEYYLKSCHLRYTKMMGNDVTYEEYLKLIKEGKGQIEIVGFNDITGKNERFPEPLIIDPGEGFAVTMTDQTLPVSLNRGWTTLYIGVDGRNRLVAALNLSSTLIKRYSEAPHSREIVDAVIIRDVLLQLYYIIGDVEDRCMTYLDIRSQCGNVGMSDENVSYGRPIFNEIVKYGEGEREDPPIKVIRPDTQ